MVFSLSSTERDTSSRNLGAFTHPASVAVVGASQDPSKWGNWIARGALTGKGVRNVYLVNPKHHEIEGQETYPSLEALPEVPELVVVVLPGHLVTATVAEALTMGSRAFLVISARVPDEAQLKALIEAHGAALIGPNSLGIYAGASQLQLMWGEMVPGTLAIISQSGQLGSEIAALARKVGVGISQFVSLGNQVSVHAVEMIRLVVEDPNTRTIGLYMEDFSRGTEIFAALRYARQHDKAVIVLTTGSSDASKDLAQSHTGAMTSATELIDAACRATGAVRVSTPSELVRVAELIDKNVHIAGSNIAVVSDSGGQAGIAADEAERLGLHLPALSGDLQESLRALLPPGASTRNPIDLAGAGEADMEVYADITRLLAMSGEVDAVILSGYFGSYGVDIPALMAQELKVASRIADADGVPILLHAMESQSEVSTFLRSSGTAVSDRVEDLLSAVSNTYAATGTPRPDLFDQMHPGISEANDQLSIRHQLESAGIPFPAMLTVNTEHEAREAARTLDGIVVLKAGWLPHKTEFGGVVLNLSTEDEVGDAFREMYSRLGSGAYTLERQDTRQDVAEYIVGARRDPSFGTVVTVGYGGTETELWGDIVIELGPVSQSEAEAMILNLTSASLLREWRGRPALDVASLAAIVSTLSGVLHASPNISEIELNPVRVGVDGALAVDCLALTKPLTTV